MVSGGVSEGVKFQIYERVCTLSNEYGIVGEGTWI